MRIAIALAFGAVLALPAFTHADTSDSDLYNRLWPETPVKGGLTVGEQLTLQLTEFGNTVGYHLDTLSAGEVGLRVDGKARRARVRLGSGQHERYLVFRIDANAHFAQGVARVQARLQLGVAGYVIALELPDFEMAPAEYRGHRGVEIRVPLFKRSF